MTEGYPERTAATFSELTTAIETPKSTRARRSVTCTFVEKEAPLPPRCSGTVIEVRPISAALVKTSRGMVLPLVQFTACVFYKRRMMETRTLLPTNHATDRLSNHPALVSSFLR